jgi:hypothetical protein
MNAYVIGQLFPLVLFVILYFVWYKKGGLWVGIPVALFLIYGGYLLSHGLGPH